MAISNEEEVMLDSITPMLIRQVEAILPSSMKFSLLIVKDGQLVRTVGTTKLADEPVKQGKKK